MRKKNQIPFTRVRLTGNESTYIQQAIESDLIEGAGPFTSKCQDWLERNILCKRALLTTSATAALEMSGLLMEIEPGHEVILPSFTFVTSATSVVIRNATPVFVDIRRDTLNIDENLIEQAITPKTKYIMPVHYAGVAANMDAISAIARRHNLKIVEDSAQALLSRYHGKPLGSIGDIGCLSFHKTKNITCGEGGAILINDEKMIERAEIILEKGTDRRRFQRGHVHKYSWVDLGSSYVPSDMLAAFLYAQFEMAEKFLEHRKRAYNIYLKELSPLAQAHEIQLPVQLEGYEHNAHIFYMILPGTKLRNEFINWCKKDDIHPTFHFVPLHSSTGGIKYGRKSSPMPVTDQIASGIVRLPLYNDISDEELERVIDRVSAFFENRRIVAA